MVGALGLPPVAGSNPAARACLAALRMVAVLDRLSICCYVGISMGQASHLHIHLQVLEHLVLQRHCLLACLLAVAQ
jgi:hypothetical protein